MHSLSRRTGLLVSLLVLLLVVLLGYEKCCRQCEQMLNGIYRDLENTAAEANRVISGMLLQIKDLEEDSGRLRAEKIAVLQSMLQPALEGLPRRGGVSLGYYSHALESYIAVTSGGNGDIIVEGDTLRHPAVEIYLQDQPPDILSSGSRQIKQICYTLPVYRDGQPIGLIGTAFPENYFYRLLWSNLPFHLVLLMLILVIGILCAVCIARTIRTTAALLGAQLDSFSEDPSHHIVPAAITQEIPLEFTPLFQKYSQMVVRVQELARELALAARLSAFGELIQVVAHEVRNPLAVIKAATEVGKVTADPEQQRQLFGRIDNAGDRINALLNRYLTLARDPLNANEEVNVQLALEGILSLLEPLFRKKEISLKSSYPLEPPLIIGDYLALEQALINLILNAVEASPQQGLIAFNLSVKDDLVELRLSDSGAGIPHEIRHQIFDRFFTTKGERGVGIGLALANSIIHKHGGKIWFEPQEGGGTTFIVQLPAAAENIFLTQKDIAAAERIK